MHIFLDLRFFLALCSHCRWTLCSPTEHYAALLVSCPLHLTETLHCRRHYAAFFYLRSSTLHSPVLLDSFKFAYYPSFDCLIYYLVPYFIINCYTYTLNLLLTSFPLDIPASQNPTCNVVQPLTLQNIPTVEPITPSRRHPARTLGLAGTNAAFLVPDHIRKKFIDGWHVHVPLTYLTDKGCVFKDKPAVVASQELLMIDNVTGHIQTSSKPLSDTGELDLTFNEWHQVWRHLLDLIRTHIPDELWLWEIHHTFIVNKENCTELWPIYLAYDVEIRKRATQLPIDPSIFSIGIWNDLEARYAVFDGTIQS